ncbi:MAG: glycosyltransferase family 39 protein [Lachnospiraceae bacterium]|nr:glycosyltransferase family 39 protein [Lachnospiraceae bacterium]
MKRIGHIIHTVFEKELRVYYLIALCSVCFILFYSAFSSPLYPGLYAWDAASFMLGGKIIANGGVLYLDYFDQKGPILFFIHALGHALFGQRIGIFILQVVFFCISALFMYKIARLFINDNKIAFGAVFLSVLLFGVTFENGALTEELSLPFILSVQYFILKFLKKVDGLHNPFCAFWYGICVVVIGLTRVTNATLCCSMILCVAILLASRKKVRNLLQNIFAFLLGVACVIIPVFLYFYEKDAMEQMLLGIYGFSTGYALHGLNKGLQGWIAWILKSMPLIAVIVTAPVYAKKSSKELGICVFFSGIMILLSLCLGNSYMHYFTLAVPLYLVGICMMQNLMNGKNLKNTLCILWQKKGVYICIFLALIFTWGYYGARLVIYSGGNFLKLTTHYYKEESDLHRKQASVIPEEDKGHVLAYNIPAKWYMETDTIPCFRYAAFQEDFRRGIPEMDEEFEDMFENTPPKWIAVGELEQVEMYVLKEALERKYELVSEVDGISIFKLNAEILE